MNLLIVECSGDVTTTYHTTLNLPITVGDLKREVYLRTKIPTQFMMLECIFPGGSAFNLPGKCSRVVISELR